MPGAVQRIIKKLVGGQEGAALVEFTVLVPLLLGLMAGFIEFGLALQQHHLVQKSMRDATRYLSQVPGYDAATPLDATSCNSTPTGGVLQAKNLAIFGNVAGTGATKIDGWVYGDVCVYGPTTKTVTYNGASADVLIIRTTTSVPYSDFGFLSIIGFSGIMLNGSHEQAYLAR